MLLGNTVYGRRCLASSLRGVEDGARDCLETVLLMSCGVDRLCPELIFVKTNFEKVGLLLLY